MHPTAEEQALHDSAQRFLAQHGDLARHRRQQAPGTPFDRALWMQLAELGWLGVMVAEEEGGLGQTPRDALAIIEAAGSHFLSEPYPQALAAAQLLQRLGSPAQRTHWLPRLCDGRTLVLPAHDEAGSGATLPCVQTRASAVADGFLIQGCKSALPWGDAADAWLVSARITGAVDAEDGLALFVLERGTPGLRLERHTGIACAPQVDLILDDVVLPPEALLGPLGGAYPALRSAHDFLLAATCTEAVGMLEAVLNATRDYTRTRRQFGTALSSFQVIAHRLVDMFTQVQLARSMAQLAAAIVCEPSPSALQQRQLAACKVQLSAACRFVAEQAVQIHGGIGMTDELALSHQVRHLLALEHRGGNDFHHLGTLTEGVIRSESLYV